MTHPVKLRVYPESAFGGITCHDGTLLYYSRINALADATDVVLDYGCGRGMHLQRSAPYYKRLCSLKGKVSKVIGVDVGSDGQGNPALDEFLRITNGKIPLPAESVDLCMSDWVVEHLEDVDGSFREIARVLKPGGYFCFRTPNRFHFSSLGASIVPFSFHHKLRQFLGHRHGEEDVFPTHYQCNTKRAARRRLREHGFEPLVQYHRGLSHLMGMGFWPGLVGRLVETVSPSFLCHEIHAFARKV